MDIIFTPPLTNQIQLSISPLHSTAVLNFTASLSSAYHAQFIREGARLQVWSDVCLDTEKPRSAEWHAFDFQTPAPYISGSTAIDVSLRIKNSTHEGNVSQRGLLSLQLSVPVTSRKHLFSFTYRVIYPTGEIRWLGQYGQNGTIILEQSQTDSEFILHEGWSMKDGGYAWTHAGQPIDDLEVARLSSSSDYSVQSIGGGSFLDAKKASLAFLVPRVLLHSVVLHPTYILSASPDITFTVSSSGVITASGSGSLFLQTPSSGSRSDLCSSVNNVIAHCPSDVCEVSALDADTEHLLLISGRKGSHLLNALVLPMKPTQTGPVQIKLNKLAGLFPLEVTEFSIFSPLSLDIHFFTKPANDSNQEVHFLTEASSGSLVLGPVFHLSDAQCQISILSDYSSARLQSKPDPGNLPTPPPSPRLHPNSPSLSHHETPSSPQLNTSGPDSYGQSDFTEDGSRQVQTPAPSDIILAYIISMATLLFTSVYQLVVGRHAQDIRGWDTGHTEEKESPLISEEEPSTPKSENETRWQVTPVTPEAPVADQLRENRHPTLVSQSLLVETHGGKVRAAFRSTSVAILAVTVDLNGRKADPTIMKLDEYISLLEVDGGTGGLLRITVNLE